MVANIGLTDIDIQLWTDSFLVLPNGTKIVAGSVTILLLIVGTILHSLVISFERYGADPQKRGLHNQVKYNH